VLRSSNSFGISPYAAGISSGGVIFSDLIYELCTSTKLVAVAEEALSAINLLMAFVVFAMSSGVRVGSADDFSDFRLSSDGVSGMLKWLSGMSR
jgi:hypothetical protein